MPKPGYESHLKIFTPEQEDKIRFDYYNGVRQVSQAYLAKKHKVDRSTIQRAIEASCKRSGRKFLEEGNA